MKIFILLLFSSVAWSQCASPYYQRSITVNSGQVTGTQTSFPMLVLNPSASLKTVGNGGRVTNSNGYDITFVNGAGSLLAFEMVGHGTARTTYDATTGNAEFWVNVSSMATGSVVYMCYGNSGVTTYQGNDSGTWNSAFKLVIHMPNGSTLGVGDSTGINTTTNHSLTAGAAQIDGGATGFTGGSNATYVDPGSNAAPQTRTFP